MLISEKSNVAINALSVVEGTFKYKIGEQSNPIVSLLFVYVNKETQETYGTCPIGMELLSQGTIDKLRAFADSAEKDFSNLIFDKQKVSVPHELKNASPAETNVGLGGK